MPPSRSGIAAYSAELLPLLRRRYTVDVFVHEPPAASPGTYSAHDFVWKQRRRPYDVTVFQLGNAACHGYMWAYLFKYPGVVVLHDAQLHQARALWLLTERVRPCRDDYLAEFRANEPEAPDEAAELIAAGLGESALYQQWPFVRLVLEGARLTLVHNERLREALVARYPGVRADVIAMGVADPAPRLDRPSILARHAVPPDALVVAAIGGVTPEKRIASLLQATSQVAARVPALHLMLVGEPATHYDAGADAAQLGIAERVHLTGYVPDDEIDAYIAAADICSCLRWPTNRETSASWLRCLAAGKPTLITALSHLVDVPPIAVAIDVLDEAQTLPAALEWLATEEGERARLGARARQWWSDHHRLENMAADYEQALSRARSLPCPRPALPAHLRNEGSARLWQMAVEMGVTDRVSDVLD